MIKDVETYFQSGCGRCARFETPQCSARLWSDGLTLALRSVQSIANSPWGAIMLGTFLSMVPLLIAFLFFSKQMMAGLTAGAVKG